MLKCFYQDYVWDGKINGHSLKSDHFCGSFLFITIVQVWTVLVKKDTKIPKQQTNQNDHWTPYWDN